MDSTQSNTQKAVKGISSQTLVVIAMGLIEVIYFSIISRLLSREDFGMFAAITAVSDIFFCISEAGIGSALIQKKDMTEDYKNTAFTLSLLIGAFFTLLLIILSGPLANLIVGEDLKYPLMILATTIFFNCLVSVNVSWMYRHLRFLTVGIIKFVVSLITSVLAILIALNGYGFYAILFKAVCGAIISFIITLIFVNTRFKLFISKFYIKSIVGFGGWLTASVMLHNLSNQLDRLLMSRFISVEALGAYNRPKDFVLQIGTRINGIFDTALFPVLSSIQDNLESLRNAFKRSMRLLNMASMGLALAFICNSTLIIRIFFGTEWLDLKYLFQIISLTLIFNINGRLGDCYLRSLGMVRQQFNLRFIELILFAISILIGFHFGLIGVAVGFLIANATIISIKTIYIASKLHISLKELLTLLFEGWGYSFYFIPLIVSQYCIIPNSVSGDLLSLAIFASSMIIILILVPGLAGREYKNNEYLVLKSQIKKKLFLK